MTSPLTSVGMCGLCLCPDPTILFFASLHCLLYRCFQVADGWHALCKETERLLWVPFFDDSPPALTSLPLPSVVALLQRPPSTPLQPPPAGIWSWYMRGPQVPTPPLCIHHSYDTVTVHARRPGVSRGQHYWHTWPLCLHCRRCRQYRTPELTGRR
jgi:hypothetical protein